eukprot:gene2019-2340_t
MSSSQGDFELDDVDIYGTDEAHDTHAAANSSDGDEDGSDRLRSFAGTSHKGVDIAGASSASQQSSVLRASLDEDLAHMPTPSPPVDMPSRRVPAFPQHHAPRPPYPRLGTSAPIAIPNMMNRWRGDKASTQQPDAASTMIPPHLLSKQDDFTFSFTGASPSATLKRERLRTRNAILRSTGFLEPQALASPAAADTLSPELALSRTP